MASWSEIEEQAPELAAEAKRYFEKHRHKTLATLRRDGSPRISGSEAELEGGELTFGSMWRGVKALDLLRDPRFALHSGADEPDDGWTGDAKVAGRAEEVASTEGASHTFRAGVTRNSAGTGVALAAEGTPVSELGRHEAPRPPRR